MAYNEMASRLSSIEDSILRLTNLVSNNSKQELLVVLDNKTNYTLSVKCDQSVLFEFEDNTNVARIGITVDGGELFQLNNTTRTQLVSLSFGVHSIAMTITASNSALPVVSSVRMIAGYIQKV